MYILFTKTNLYNILPTYPQTSYPTDSIWSILYFRGFILDDLWIVFCNKLYILPWVLMDGIIEGDASTPIRSLAAKLSRKWQWPYPHACN